MRCLYLPLTAFLLLPPPASGGGDPKQFARWEKDIAAFEKRDQEQPPPKNAILFVGSSTIRGWDLAKYFPGVEAINRGFGGSQTADVAHFTPRIVLPYQPRLVVFYSGDNDINAKKTPEQVFADFKSFEQAVHKALPKTKILVLSIKPSPSRWKLYDQMKQANKLIADYAKATPNVTFVDLGSRLLGDDGMPRAEFYAKDNLHLSAAGYKVWSEALQPYLK